MFGKKDVENFSIGQNPEIGSNVSITGPNGGRSKNIRIGHNCYIGDNVQIKCDNFSLGDYGRIHHNTTIHGSGDCIIGHNLWCGQYTILDCQGGLLIGDNCGIGAHSQLWSHIRYGDMLEGCKFETEKTMEIGDDVWFVGHCIVSPIKAESKSMALVGSVITKDMDYNTLYAGVPAKEINGGTQFREVPLEEKLDKMIDYLAEHGATNIKIVESREEISEDTSISYFNVSDRKYTQRLTSEECSFMKFLLPTKAKFTPYENY